MGKIVKIYVVDNSGNTLSGQKVWEYGGERETTNRDGCVNLFLANTNTTIYVNGFEAYSGPASRLDTTEFFKKNGGRP